MSENEQLILQLIKVNKNLKKLRKQLKSGRKLRGPEFEPEKWGFMQEVLEKLSISKSTLYRWRADDKVRWEQKGGTSYYYLPDLLKLKYKCMK